MAFALSLLTFLPLPAMLLIFFLPQNKASLAKSIALLVSLVQFIWVCVLIFPAVFYPTSVLNINERFYWLLIPLGEWGSLKIDYALRLDGLNGLMVLLTSIIFIVATLSSWSVVYKSKAYFALLLLLNISLFGCFMAQDFFLFFLFYELMLIPMFFLIGIWGGEKSEYAALKFFLFTFFGSVFMLLTMIGLALSTISPEATAVGLKYISCSCQATPEVIEKVQKALQLNQIANSQMTLSFNFDDLSRSANYVQNRIFYDPSLRFWGFCALFVAFAIKLPVVPIHTWLPLAHVQASTPISIILAGVLLKVGGYGLLKIAIPIFPDVFQAHRFWIAMLALVSILYGGLNALGQKDLKSMVAYSSINQMGFVLLGLVAGNAVALSGSVLQMFNHGIITAMLFFSVGVLYDRVKSWRIDYFRGLWSTMPIYTTFVGLCYFAALGLPGLSAFVSEMLIFTGAFQAATHHSLAYFFPTIAILGILLTAAYLLWAFQRMFFGKYEVFGGAQWKEQLVDLHIREKGIYLFLAFWVIFIGLYPTPALQISVEIIKQWVRFF